MKPADITGTGTVEERLSRLEAIARELLAPPQEPPRGVLEAAHQRFKERIRTEPAKARGQE